MTQRNQYLFLGGTFPTGTPGSGFYGGLQTRVGNQTPVAGKRGVIFSAFGVIDATPEAGSHVDIDEENCDGGTGAVCAQLSTVLDWKNGSVYRFVWEFVGDAPGEPANELLQVRVVDVGLGASKTLGTFVIPKSWGRLPHNVGYGYRQLLGVCL